MSQAVRAGSRLKPVFPMVTELSYKESFKQWFERKSLADYEARVLSYLPFFPKSDGLREAKTLDVPVDAKGNKIHELYIENKEKVPEERHLVIVHGFGAALGFFYRNFNGLSMIPGVKIHALDLLGYGLSSRPKFPSLDPTKEEDIHKAEDFFVDSMEAWRKERNIDRFVLVGHSLGGYLSSCYSLKYKDAVEKLILVSPVGIERSEMSLTEINRPPAVQAQDIARKSSPNIEEELLQSQEQSQQHHQNVSDSASIASTESRNNDERMQQASTRPQLRKFLVKLWENHCSVFSIVRAAAPFGPKLVSLWTFSRFGAIEDPQELMDIHRYSYNTFVAKGSGEYSLTVLLAPGAWARLPLLDRLPGNITVPTLWLYGENDWMSKKAGRECVSEINSQGEKSAKFRIIDGAGHHVYLDNPTDFNQSVRKFVGW
ncbi:BA75_05020T0 [Komagataella pastoris]|uniref:BA75_05020T0 n=1 Tax=Komagataella pastoris TaxID=4922 RepID=A0A1B2JHY0_PICPA|nr:BA75_05020T0 [Komagataella pastoris]